MSSSKSCNNSSFLNNSCKKNQLRQTIKQEEAVVKATNKEVLEKETQQKEQKAVWQELRHFYPLSEKDISLLNSRAGREFSANFVNQLLLKLYIKYPEKRFKNKFTFLSYMSQILANEKHQGPLVNHTSFRFSCNIGEEEKNLLEYEKYLNEIENSFDTSKEMCVKKKIAGIFSTDIAYKILTRVEFRTNHDHSFITALIPNNHALSERQIEILSDQLEVVYGINGFYVQEQAEKETLPTKYRTSDILADGSKIDTTKENTIWQEIRKGLRAELGEHIDKAWFSKALATEHNENSTLTLTMPTRFMSDWIRNNYSHVIRRLALGCGVKRVEYGYE